MKKSAWFVLWMCPWVCAAPWMADAGAPDSMLGDPLTVRRDVPILRAATRAGDIPQAAAGLSVNPDNRESSRSFYYAYYAASSAAEGQNTGWTGDYGSCAPGTTSQAFRDALLTRINYFRAMAGLPANIALLSSYSDKCQNMALMISVNHLLSHYPPPSWLCYTAEGAKAATNSNLHYHGGKYEDPITSYLFDRGDSNIKAKHRSWILYPQTQYMGTGDVPEGSGNDAANALWIVDEQHIWDARPPMRHEYVAWPPPGFVPYPVVYARWSFAYVDADFSSATVSMSAGGASLPLKVESRSSVAGYAPENNIVWIPNDMSNDQPWPNPSADRAYTVFINNVVISNKSRSFAYTVTVFDPAASGGLWSSAYDLGGGWKYLPWFGCFAVNGDWIYHNEHGWMYCAGTTTASIWFWTADMDWLWSADWVYPSFYRIRDSTWLWYQKGSKAPRWFLNMTTGLWERH